MTEKRPISKGITARNAALKQLIERHQDEFDQLLGDAREDAGLPRDAAEANRKQQIQKHLDRLRELGFDLGSAS
jgi:vacuolar-type H+-ATPase subunit H